MADVAVKKKASRPPAHRAKTAGRAGTQAADASPTAELLRRRLAQAETHLREMEDEAYRVRTQQSRELEVVQNDYKSYLDQVEVLRMEECMTPAELQAIHVDATIVGSGADTKKTHSGSKAASTARPTSLDSKLLASTSVKYREARDLTQEKRAECAEMEARLAAARSKLAGYRSKRQQTHRAAQGSVYAASVRQSQVAQIQSQSREQLRGLEVHVAMEQERLSSMVSDAKKLRSDIDTLLITQSRFEKTYRKREDELLEKKKQMSFIVEVCTLLFEEREQKRREIAELRALSTDENKKYEVALEELDAVLAENTRSQLELDDKIAAAKKEVRETQKTRAALERANAATEKFIARQREQTYQQQRGLTDASVASSNTPTQTRAVYQQQPPHQSGRLNNVDGATEAARQADEDNVLLDSAQHQIQQFDLFYERLAELAGSNRMDDVVSYPDISAEERFRFFSELHYLRDETAKLQEERARLIGEPTGMEGEPTKSVTSLADVSPHTAASEDGEDQSASAMAAQRREMEDSVKAQRAVEMEQLQATLDRLTLLNAEQGEEAEALDVTYESVVEHVRQMFSALGCDPAVVRQLSGAGSVLRNNLTTCLSLVDQRVEEYLLALARDTQVQRTLEQERQLLTLQEGGDGDSIRDDEEKEQRLHALAAQQLQQQKHSVARTFLRRKDLPPRVIPDSERRPGEANTSSAPEGNSPLAFTGSRKQAGQQGWQSFEGSLSAKQLVQRTRGGLPRSVDPHPGVGGAGAKGTGARPTSTGTPLSPSRPPGRPSGTTSGSVARAHLSAADAEVPLSMEEMQRIVRERQGVLANPPVDTRRFQ